MSRRTPLAPALCEFINDDVEKAWRLRDEAELARLKVGGPDLTDAERDLVFRPLPVEPTVVMVSPAAFAALVVHDHGALIELNRDTGLGKSTWLLAGCGLPLVRDTAMDGHSFRVDALYGDEAPE